MFFVGFRLCVLDCEQLFFNCCSFLFQLNTLNERGLTVLMLAVIRHDEPTVRMLLDLGVDPNVETPPQGISVSVQRVG